MWRISLLVIVVLVLSVSVQAKPKKANKDVNSQGAAGVQTEHELRAAFSPAERNLIRARLLGKEPVAAQATHESLPAGLQKKVARGKALPPGWQKKITPGHSLDYQVYRQGRGLPAELLLRLPPPPTGSEVLQVENKVIRIVSATRLILDAFDLAPAR